MSRETLQSSYNATYTSFSGADIIATFNGHVIGELQAISYSVTREKAPIYTMGSPDPRSFSRGKRGIAGSLVFTVFDKDALYELKNEKYNKIRTALANKELRDNLLNNEDVPFASPDEWEDLMQGENLDAEMVPYYADEIPPFDITITMVNEYGQAAKFSILGVEILNEGSGMSIDDITTEKACTFVARAITPLEKIDRSQVSSKDIVNRNF